ncbi:hypothetical protein KP509_01G069100 [Ceratopteris richardii]|uniref:Uncharacterized protein n=1 Tax=Ceratopteris richardii TaxID=49495 RepID=A0A8T2VDY9_CERRI|nr:hypothetical protein KP509_01G069100 [Ceratopteris richardii]
MKHLGADLYIVTQDHSVEKRMDEIGELAATKIPIDPIERDLTEETEMVKETSIDHSDPRAPEKLFVHEEEEPGDNSPFDNFLKAHKRKSSDGKRKSSDGKSLLVVIGFRALISRGPNVY